MNTFTTFNFRDNSVRVVTLDGNPWFVAADVCKALGYNVKADGSVNVSQALKPLQADEVTTTQISGQRGLPMKLISESGLYKLVLRSDKPQARAFQDWVTREVLPAIRKDRMYVAGEEKVRTGEMNDLIPLHEIQGEPRVLDTELATALGMANVYKIRGLIRDHADELASFGDISPRRGEIRGPGLPSTFYYLNEEQALLVCTLARTERAKQVRAMLIKVFVAWRRGELVEPEKPTLPDFTSPAEAARAWVAVACTWLPGEPRREL
ncbi:BRO-N domain-containing protein [Azospirillum sp. ST 5-10]|uniref:BRO-N domain-containing protein n=1 Tax=unclassified Azospirillum TaxID=2630922 RepID=UPI003F4A2CB5